MAVNCAAGQRGLVSSFAPAERAAPEEIRRDAESLRGSALLAEVLDVLPELVLILNRTRQAVFANRAVGRFLGEGLAPFIGLRPGEILACRNALDPSASGCGTARGCKYCGAVEAILNSLAGRSHVAECRLLRKTPSGAAALDIRVWASPFVWQERKFSLFVVSSIDAEKRNAVLERLFFHDILNTAAAITGMAELLQNGEVTVDDLGGDLLSSAETLVEEIRAHRDLLAAENHELAVHWTLVNARGVFDQAAAWGRRLGCAAGKTVRIAGDGAPAVFVSDAVLLGRVVGNMLKNALEASGDGDTVTLRCSAGGDGWIRLSCHNGEVIPPEILSQIFTRSFSTKGGGRGLGSYGMKLLVENYLRGDVEVESLAGKGTTVTVRLPAMREPPPAAACGRRSA